MLPILPFSEMLRVQYPQSSMGVSHVWDLDLPGMFGPTSRARRSHEFRSIRDHGQVERKRVEQNESGRQQEGQGFPYCQEGLGSLGSHQAEVS